MKKKKTPVTSRDTRGASTVVLDDKMVAARAYSIWQEEGEPDGREIDHWLKAEAELRGNSAGRALGISSAKDA